MKDITKEVLNSKKYFAIDEEVIKFISKEEAIKFKKQSDVVKSVKNKLHQVHEVFLPADDLKSLSKCDAEALLRLHVSTRERLGFYQEFLKEVFDSAAKVLNKDFIESCIDIGAGFNGVALCEYGYFKNRINSYKAFDINREATQALNKFFELEGCQNAVAITQGIFDEDLKIDAEVCLMLKLLPVLISQCSGKTQDILDRIFSKINSKVVIVSFPIKSLSGRDVGMAENYEKNIIAKLPKNWQAKDKLCFENEIVYIIENI